MRTTHKKECTNFNEFINKLKEEMEKDKVILPRCRTFTFKIIDRLASEYRKSTQDELNSQQPSEFANIQGEEGCTEVMTSGFGGSGVSSKNSSVGVEDRQNEPNRNDCLCCKGICDCEYGCSHVHKELDANQDKGEGDKNE